jgi:hypothetical protein
MDALDANELARISSALIAAAAEAYGLAQNGKFGPEFRDLVQHAREMHALMIEHVQRADADAVAPALEVAEGIGNRLDLIAATLARELY